MTRRAAGFIPADARARELAAWYVVATKLSAGLALTIALAAAASPAQSQNLAHFFSFDTPGVASDAGGRAAGNGALVGGASVSGGALQLDGVSAYVQFGSNLVPASPPYTVAFFARAESGAHSGANGDFISQGSSCAAFFIGLAPGGGLRAGDNWPSVAGGTFIADGQFHHYALTMSASGASFYVDGMLIATDAPFAGGAGGTPTRLGRGTGDADTYFSGSLDDLRIYDDALSDDLIRELAGGSPSRPDSAKPLNRGRAPSTSIRR